MMQCVFTLIWFWAWGVGEDVRGGGGGGRGAREEFNKEDEARPCRLSPGEARTGVFTLERAASGSAAITVSNSTGNVASLLTF